MLTAYRCKANLIKSVNFCFLEKKYQNKCKFTENKNYLNGPPLAWLNICPQFWALGET